MADVHPSVDNSGLEAREGSPEAVARAQGFLGLPTVSQHLWVRALGAPYLMSVY